MRTVILAEYEQSVPVSLSIAARDELSRLVSDLAIAPVPGTTGQYLLRGGSTVGVVRVDDLTLELRPKIGVAAVLFLVSYALDPKSWKDQSAALAADASLAEAIVPLFAHHVEQAVRPGLLHGYRHLEDTLTTVRGRVRMAAQFRVRTGLPMPVEVSYDDYTPDILENRLLLAAVEVLGRTSLRHRGSRIRLDQLRRRLDGVGGVLPDGRGVPEPRWTRLNERYRPAVALARLILAGASLEARAGGLNANAFLVNMNAVFEQFIRAALREALRLDQHAFPDGLANRTRYLDTGRRIRLQPDLTWWADDRCVFAADCKYKDSRDSVPNPDVYQMLAYLTALRLADALLVYAVGPDEPRTITIPHAGKRITTWAVDVSQEPDQVLARVADLAAEIARTADVTPARLGRTPA
jgi:5-methylcytosine-specific restriction enzyme subunit McrC